MPVEKDGSGNAPQPTQFGGSLLMLLFFLFLFHFVIAPGLRSPGNQVPYSQFRKEVKDGKVGKVSVSQDEIQYILKADLPQPPQPQPGGSPSPQPSAQSPQPQNSPPLKIYVTTPITNDQSLPELLDKSNVEYGVIPPNRGNIFTTLLGWMIPPLIFVGIWLFAMNRAQAGAGTALTVGKSKARIYSEGHTGVTFADVAGIDEAKVELQEVVEFLKDSAKYTCLRAKIPKGVLLVGAPGTGKTLLAKIERVIAGLEKKSRMLNEVEKKIVAYHEAGHAILGALMPGAGKVEKISIVPRGVGAYSSTLQLPEEDRFLMSASEIRGRIATLLAGRSAEETVLGEISTGADDIQKATDLAERVVTLYGMSQKLGPIALERVQSQILEGFSNPRRPISPKVTEEIDQEVKEIVDGAHHIALQILEGNRALLEEITQHLLQKEVLEGEPLGRYLAQAKAPSELETWLHTGQIASVAQVQ